MIESRLMATGSVSVELEGLPGSIRALEPQYDTVLILPQRPWTTDVDALRSAAVAACRVEEWDPGTPGRPAKIGGPGLLAWLGDGANKGPWINGGAAAGPLAGTLASYLASGGVFGTAEYVAGFTLNTSSTPSLSGNSLGDYVEERETLLPALQRWRKMTTVETEFKLGADLVLRLAPVGSSTLFAQTPRIVLTRNGTQGPYSGMRGYRCPTLERSTDWSQYTLNVSVFGDSGAASITASALSSTLKAADGSTDLNVNKHLGNIPSATGNDAVKYAEVERTGHYSEHSQWRITVDAQCFLQDCIPGDYVYVWDQYVGAVDTANVVMFGGRHIFPEKVRVTAVREPIRRGSGVVLVRNATGDADGTPNEVIDLSRWLKPEKGETSLEIDDAPVSLTEKIRGAA